MAEAPENRPAPPAGGARPAGGDRPERPAGARPAGGDRAAAPAEKVESSLISGALSPLGKDVKGIGDLLEWFFVWFIIIALLLRAAAAFTSSSTSGSGGVSGGTTGTGIVSGFNISGLETYFQNLFAGILAFLQSFLTTFGIFADFLCLFFFIGIVYAIIRTKEVEEEWYKNIYPAEVSDALVMDKPKNSRWQLVLDHISSDNPSDWRLAILESDIILADLFDTLGYSGDTVGDKLRNAEKAPFNTLNAAWEAHRIRNAIAHEGQDFVLTQREARRIVGLYESVFNEFDYV